MELFDRFCKASNSDTFTKEDIVKLYLSSELSDLFGIKDRLLPNPALIDYTVNLPIPPVEHEDELVSFDHLGPVIVRPLSVYEQSVTFSTLCDRILSDNPKPSSGTQLITGQIVTAQLAIVAPVDLVDSLLSSPDGRDLLFFQSFYNQYSNWLKKLGYNYKERILMGPSVDEVLVEEKQELT